MEIQTTAENPFGSMLQINEIEPARIKEDANLFQSPFWAAFKENRGYDTQAFRVRYQGRQTTLLVVHRPCTACDSFGYVPHGPDIAVPQEMHGRILETIAEKIRRSLPGRCRFLRFDLPWQSPYISECPDPLDWSGPPAPRIRELRMNFGCRYWNLRKAPTDMQPQSTVILDLRLPADALLAGMHAKHRYSIRRSFRLGVEVQQQQGAEALPRWHRVYQGMAERKGIVAENLDYFSDLFAAARCHASEIRLYQAFHNKVLLAGCLVAYHGDSAYYLHSASSREGRKRLAAYALLWQVILDAQAGGYRRLDLMGIPPDRRPDHPLHGLYRFKTRFGGHIRHFRGCWDYPFDPEGYSSLAFTAAMQNPFHRN